MTNAVDAYIGIGSNLNNPEDQVRRAFDEIAALPRSCCMARSPLYRSQPVGPQEQPYFINAVVRLGTSLEAEALLTALQRIEQAHCRKRGLRWARAPWI
jgi:2-amino-4-hydroxy-6-hydroxymethyldihydropteridine diphosphokinase